MKTQNMRDALVKIGFLFCASAIMFFPFINCPNIVHAGERLTVSASKANIRSGPGTNYSIVLQAEKGVAFKVIKRKGSWIHVLHADGDKGWIYNDLVW